MADARLKLDGQGAKGVGAWLNQSIAGMIVGGQVLSLLLTRLTTSVVDSLFDDLQVRPRRRRESEYRSAVPLEVR